VNHNSEQANGLIGWWPDGKHSFFPAVPDFAVTVDNGGGSAFIPTTAIGKLGTIGSGYDNDAGMQLTGHRVTEALVQAQHPQDFTISGSKQLLLSYWLYITTQTSQASTTPWSSPGPRTASVNPGRLTLHYSSGTIARFFSASGYTGLTGIRGGRWIHVLHGARANASNATLGVGVCNGQELQPGSNSASAWTVNGSTTIGGSDYASTVHSTIDTVVADVRLYYFTSDAIQNYGLPCALERAMFLPATRWDLWQGAKWWVMPQAVAGGSIVPRKQHAYALRRSQ